MDGAQVLRAYKAHSQSEFLYPSATKEKLPYHLNAALMAVSGPKAAYTIPTRKNSSKLLSLWPTLEYNIPMSCSSIDLFLCSELSPTAG